MSQQTAQCPNCRMTNSLRSVNCLECGQQLPWGPAVLAAQQQAQAAQQAALAAQQAAQARPAPGPRAPYGQPGPGAPTAAPGFMAMPGGAGEDPHGYAAFGGSFLGERTFDNVEPGGALVLGAGASLLFVLTAGFGIYRWIQLLLTQIAQIGVAFTSALSRGSLQPAPASPSFDGSMFLKSCVLPLIFAVGLFFMSLVLRKLASRDDNGNVGNDLFVIGVGLLPLGLWMMLSSFIGINHQKIVSLLGVAAFCYTVAILHSGYTKVSRIKPAVATFGVAAFIAANLLICQMVVQKMLQDAMPKFPV